VLVNNTHCVELVTCGVIRFLELFNYFKELMFMLYVISSCVLLFVCGVQYLTIEKTSLVVPVLLCVSVAIESDVD